MPLKTATSMNRRVFSVSSAPATARTAGWMDGVNSCQTALEESKNMKELYCLPDGLRAEDARSCVPVQQMIGVIGGKGDAVDVTANGKSTAEVP
jgi:hypothetical protein